MGEHGYEAMQLAVEQKALDDLRPVGLEAAVQVVQPQPGDAARDPVEEL
jgi:hypothetical protein